MDEIKIVDKADTIKIDKPNEKKILKKLEKTDEWEKIKVIKGIYNEIEDYGIEKEDIGLNCAKYLNKVGETGKFEIEELYNTCYKLKALRNKRKKKEKKEKAPKKGKAGKAPVDKKVKEDKDIDKAKSKSVEDMLSKALASATDEEGNIDYNKLFTGVSKLFCGAGIKSGLNGIYNSLINNWDNINQVGWTSSGWEFGKELMTEVFKMASSCSGEILTAVGGIAGIITLWNKLYGKIVRTVSREGDPPTDDDDEDPDASGEGSGLPSAGGLTQTTPQAGLLTYSATDVEGERVSNLQNSFSQLIQRQRSQDNREKQSQQNTLIENEIKSTPAYSNKQSMPDTKPTSRTTEENIIRGEELTPPRPIRKKPETNNEGISKTQAGLGIMGLLGGAGAYYGRPQPLAPVGRPEGTLFREPLIDEGEDFFDAQEPPKDIPKKPTIEERINKELDEKERIGKGLATAMVMGGQGGKLAQASLSPLVLYLRGQTENPTLKLKSIQSQTEQKSNPEQEALLKQMNDDMDVINSLIDQSNQDVKPTREQYDLREKQQQLMRDINTNTTPVEEVEEPDINEFINEINDFSNEIREQGDMTLEDTDTPLSTLGTLGELQTATVNRMRTEDLLERQRIKQENQRQKFKQEQTLNEYSLSNEEILEELNRENERQRTKQVDSLREYSLSSQGGIMGEEPEQNASLQIEEGDKTSNAEEQSLYPTRIYREIPTGSSGVRYWEDYLRQFYVDTGKQKIEIRDLQSNTNPIISEALNEMNEFRISTGRPSAVITASEGRELMERLINAQNRGNRENIPMRERKLREENDKSLKKKKK